MEKYILITGIILSCFGLIIQDAPKAVIVLIRLTGITMAAFAVVFILLGAEDGTSISKESTAEIENTSQTERSENVGIYDNSSINSLESSESEGLNIQGNNEIYQRQENQNIAKYVSIEDLPWLENTNVTKGNTSSTMRGDTWYNCIMFGTSNLNADGTAYITIPCDKKYSRFKASIAPQEGFDSYESVMLSIFCTDENGLRSDLGQLEINHLSETIEIDCDVSNAVNLSFYKYGEYNMARIAGQYLNGYSGMGVLMKDAKLYL